MTTATRPANPADPGDPGYDFSEIDSAVRDAQARGLDVMFTVFNAPEWAEGPNRPPVSNELAPAGTWKPRSGRTSRTFATALATRYSGNYTPASGGGPLPDVRNYEAWNEENLWAYLSPQYEGNKQASRRALPGVA